MSRVNLHLKANHFEEILEPVRTGRQIHEETYLQSRVLSPSQGPELQGFDNGMACNVRDEINFRLVIGVTTCIRDHHSQVHRLHWANKKFTQYFLTPVMPDLDIVRDLIEAGQYESALDHVEALQARICGMSHGR